MMTAHRSLKVAIIYHFWPHYREPVMRALNASKMVDFDFFGSGEPLEGIVHADTSAISRFIKAPFSHYGRMLWQPEAVVAARSGRYDAIIFLADPNFVSTWVGAMAARLRGVPVLFWGHGWLKPEGQAKTLVRKLYFALSKRFLIYSERGKRMGVAAGFPPEKITVVYNSLDVGKANAVIARIESGELDSVRPQSFFKYEYPLIICTARLTEKCRFDLLLDAAALLAKKGRPVNVLLVGDGPARRELEQQADRLGTAVHFFGACYDEETTGQLIYRADLTVSPGKIGLTAMHSLMYGTPAITHDDLDEQMPEVEAIIKGQTGAFFTRGSAASLADAINNWLSAAPMRSDVREAARSEIRAKWTPERQAALIEQAVLEVSSQHA